jgi:hypothetical protein
MKYRVEILSINHDSETVVARVTAAEPKKPHDQYPALNFGFPAGARTDEEFMRGLAIAGRAHAEMIAQAERDDKPAPRFTVEPGRVGIYEHGELFGNVVDGTVNAGVPRVLG